MENDSKKKEIVEFKYRYINNPDHILSSWNHYQDELSKCGKIEFFYGFICPVCVAEIDIVERVRGEYGTVEFLILKLIDNKITDAQMLSDLTGLNIEMVTNILDVLENSYGHIKNGEITEEGRNSLLEGNNIQCYETTRQIQLEGLSGIVLIPELLQTRTGDLAYYDFDREKADKFKPTETVIVNLKRDVADILNEYQEYEMDIFDRNIEHIKDISVEGSINVECFLVKYDFLPHPFLLFPSQQSNYIRWIPVAISESNKKILDEKGVSFKRDVVVGEDYRFERITQIYNDARNKDEALIEKADFTQKFYKTNERDGQMRAYVADDGKDSVPVVYRGCKGRVFFCKEEPR